MGPPTLAARDREALAALWADGEQTGWSYLLVRQDDRWVVFSQGVG